MKWILRLVGFFVVLVLVAGVALFFLPAERIARVAADQLASITGRDVAIRGDVGLTVWPVLGLRADDFEVGAPDWATLGPTLQAETAAIGLDARSLLGGDIRITHLELERPTVRLETAADGRASWLFSDPVAAVDPASADPGTAAPTPSETRSISIDRVRIEDATLIYRAEEGETLRYDAVDLTLDWPDPAGAAELNGAFSPGGSEVTVAATVEGFAAFLAGNVTQLRARLTAGGGSLDFDGRAGTDGAVSGNLDLRTAPTDAFLRALGVAPVGLPADLGQSVALTTAVTLTPDLRLSLRDIVAKLGANRVTGAADIDLGGTPRINAQLDAGALDLRSALAGGAPSDPGGGGSGGSGGAPATSAPATGWPTATIDASGLAAFDGEIALTAASVDLGRFAFGPTRTILRNERSRLVFELRDVQAYSGRITGEFIVNNRSGLSVGAEVQATGVQMQPLLNDALDLDRLTGAAALKLSFLGAGPSVDAIMKSLSGDGRIEIGQGTIEGINLDRLMRGGDVASGTTIFDSLTGSWTIESGVLRNDDLLFQLRNYEARGAGTVGLGAQTVDYTFTPVALRANSGEGLAIPVRFQGPWSDVSIRPDLEAALDLQIDEEIDKLEAEAKQRIDDTVDRKIEETLGVMPQDGQSTEDAIKDKLQDRLLRKLFD